MALALRVVDDLAGFRRDEHLLRVHLVLRQVLHLNLVEIAQTAMKGDIGRIDASYLHHLEHLAREVDARAGCRDSALVFGERSLEVQRGVVMEEFKQRCLNQPYGDVGHLLRPLAYRAHTYQWPTIGKDLSHIANATLEEVKAFFFRFYAPNNAVLAVTGNISFEEAVALTEKWFGPIPRREVPQRNLPQEPEQTEERRLTVERNVPLDSLFMAYHMCSHDHPDYYAFDILSDLLSNGRSSRLNQRLVQQKQLFSRIDAELRFFGREVDEFLPKIK